MNNKQGKLYHYFDIGNGAVKYLKVIYENTNPVVIDASLYNLPLSVIEAGEENEKISLWLGMMEDIVRSESVLPESNVSLILPGEVTIVRYNTLPNIPVSKIKNIIKYEAEQQIPLPFDEIEWAYDILPHKTGKEVNVVIVAAKKSVTVPFREFFLKRGIIPLNFESVQLMLANSILSSDIDNVVSIDLGAFNTSVTLKCGNLLWGRSLRLGQMDITESVSKRLAVSLHEAEHIKRNFAMKNNFFTCEVKGDDAAVKEEIYALFGKILEETQKTLKYFFSRRKEAAIDKIILSGGGSFVSGATEFLSSNMGLVPVKSDVHFAVSDKIRQMFSYDKNFYKTISGAVKSGSGIFLSTNLVGEEIKREREIKRYKKSFMFWGLVLLSFLLIMDLNMLFDFFIKEKNRKVVYRYLNEIESDGKKLRKIEREIDKKVALFDKVSEAVFAEKKLMLFIKSISRVIPSETWIETFSYDNGGIMLYGRTFLDLSVIKKFKTGIEDVNGVESADIISANVDESGYGEGRTLRSFVISIKIDVGDICGNESNNGTK